MRYSFLSPAAHGDWLLRIKQAVELLNEKHNQDRTALVEKFRQLGTPDTPPYFGELVQLEFRCATERYRAQIKELLTIVEQDDIKLTDADIKAISSDIETGFSESAHRVLADVKNRMEAHRYSNLEKAFEQQLRQEAYEAAREARILATRLMEKRKSKAERTEGSLEAKPPEIVQNIAWILKYGWRYKWYCLAAIVFVALLFRLDHGPASNSSVRPPPDSQPPPDAAQLDYSGQEFLKSDLTPRDILLRVEGLSDEDRIRVLADNYQRRRIPGSKSALGWRGEVRDAPVLSDGKWLIILEPITLSKVTGRKRTAMCITLVTDHDSSRLDRGDPIRYWGMITRIEHLGLLDTDSDSLNFVVDGEYVVE